MTDQFDLIAPEDERYAQTEFVVEATSCERLNLWERWNKSLEWEQDSMGLLETVGFLDGNEERPVCISITWHILGGIRILFWEATSRFVDNQMIEQWLEKYVPCRWDRGTRSAHTNAMNFHHVVNHLTDLQGASIG